MSKQVDIEKLKTAYQTILSSLPLQHESVDRTPLRAAKALAELTKGYYQTVEEIVGQGIFPHTGTSIVHVKNIHTSSICEHHLLPFYGTCAITYIPNGKILGLSKLKRIVDVFSKRLQVQERLTDQIADSIERLLEPSGVLVVIRSTHMCMKMRGVLESNSETVTVSSRGVFKTDPTLRQQYYTDSCLNPKL